MRNDFTEAQSINSSAFQTDMSMINCRHRGR